MKAVLQDAFMERGTTSPYVSILTNLGLICDENAPTTVPDEVMDEVPDARVSKLEE